MNVLSNYECMTGAVLFSDSVKHIGEYNTELNKGVMGLNPGFGSLSSPTASLQVIKWPCIKKKKKSTYKLKK